MELTTSYGNELVDSKRIEIWTLTDQWEYMLDNQWAFYPYFLEESIAV